MSIPLRPDKVTRTLRTIQGISTCKSAPKWRLWAIRPEWAHAGVQWENTKVDQWLPWLVQSCTSKAATSAQQWNEVQPPNLVVMRDTVLRSWLFTWPKRSPLFSERFWHTRPSSCTMTALWIYYALITGYSRFTRNYCTHRPAAMPPGNVKENDLAVAWHGLQPKQRKPSASGTSFSDWIRRYLSGGHLTGMVSAHWAPVVLQQLQKKKDKYRAESVWDEEVALADIRSNGRR